LIQWTKAIGLQTAVVDDCGWFNLSFCQRQGQ